MPDAADPTPPDADQRATDERQAQAEVQQMLSASPAVLGTQLAAERAIVQALQAALVAARAEVARLTRENAELQAKAEVTEGG